MANDGERIGTMEGRIVFFSTDRGDSTLWLLENGKLNTLNISAGGHPRFSKDGETIYYGYTDIRGMMLAYNVKTNTIQELANINKYGPYEFDVYDGKVAFTSRGLFSKSDSVCNLYVMNLNSTECKQLTFFTYGGKGWGAVGAYHPRWSPDGKTILFTGPDIPNYSGVPDAIYLINADGTNMKKIIGNDQMVNATKPSWSPDGKTIVFDGFKTFDKPVRPQIFIANADGTNIRQVTNSPFKNEEGVFSPDGTKICFMSNRHVVRKGLVDWRGGELYVINVDGTNEIRITPPNVIRQGLFGMGKVYSTDSEPDWHE